MGVTPATTAMIVARDDLVIFISWLFHRIMWRRDILYRHSFMVRRISIALILRWWKMRTRRSGTIVTSEVTMATAGMTWNRVPEVVPIRTKSIESSGFGWINMQMRWNSPNAWMIMLHGRYMVSAHRV
jgi:hypothetical protein